MIVKCPACRREQFQRILNLTGALRNSYLVVNGIPFDDEEDLRTFREVQRRIRERMETSARENNGHVTIEMVPGVSPVLTDVGAPFPSSTNWSVEGLMAHRFLVITLSGFLLLFGAMAVVIGTLMSVS